MLDGKYEKTLLDIKELCEYLGIGMTKARELVRERNGFGVQIGNHWYIEFTRCLWEFDCSVSCLSR